MPVPAWKECHTGFSGPLYKVTNEEPEMLSSLLGKRSFKRTAGILSAGEVLLSVLLPRSREVVAIDHSYGSIAVAYLKVILLDTMGAKALKDLLFEATTPEQLKPLLERAMTSIPPELTKHIHASDVFRYDLPSLRKEWHYMPLATLERARQRLDRVTFIHGDIVEDLAAEGQFSLLYVSNAMEHTGRTHRSPILADFAKLVQPGGYLLSTTTNKPFDTKEWDLVKYIAGVRSSWNHVLHKRKG